MKEDAFNFRSKYLLKQIEGGKDAEIVCFWNMEMMQLMRGASCRIADMAGCFEKYCVSIMLSKVGRFLYRPLFLLRRKIPLLYLERSASSVHLDENRKAGFLWQK